MKPRDEQETALIRAVQEVTAMKPLDKKAAVIRAKESANDYHEHIEATGTPIEKVRGAALVVTLLTLLEEKSFNQLAAACDALEELETLRGALSYDQRPDLIFNATARLYEHIASLEDYRAGHWRDFQRMLDERSTDAFRERVSEIAPHEAVNYVMRAFGYATRNPASTRPEWSEEIIAMWISSIKIVAASRDLSWSIELAVSDFLFALLGYWRVLIAPAAVTELYVHVTTCYDELRGLEARSRDLPVEKIIPLHNRVARMLNDLSAGPSVQAKETLRRPVDVLRRHAALLLSESVLSPTDRVPTAVELSTARFPAVVAVLSDLKDEIDIMRDQVEGLLLRQDSVNAEEAYAETMHFSQLAARFMNTFDKLSNLEAARLRLGTIQEGKHNEQA